MWLSNLRNAMIWVFSADVAVLFEKVVKQFFYYFLLSDNTYATDTVSALLLWRAELLPISVCDTFSAHTVRTDRTTLSNRCHWSVTICQRLTWSSYTIYLSHLSTWRHCPDNDEVAYHNYMAGRSTAIWVKLSNLLLILPWSAFSVMNFLTLMFGILRS